MLDLLEALTRAFFDDADEIRYIDLDMAFLNNIKACGQYTPAEVDELFGIWLKVFDHENPQPPTPDESARLTEAVAVIIAYRQRLN